MKLKITEIGKTINKAYLTMNESFENISRFQKNFQTLLAAIDRNDSEETLKNYINVFFFDTYYKQKFAIKENLNNIDLAIYNGKNADSKIGVIVETKALKNSSEMISADDINRKAFHELIRYYFEERKTNLELKHLIITNSIDWYIFDATEFERLFYQNKTFRNNYNSLTNNQLVSKNTDLFYSEIAKPFLENSDEYIACTYVRFDKVSEDFANYSEQKWLELYKLFSPEHLLKLPFKNDGNVLNREFYNELLHILGLKETKDGGLKKIERLDKSDRNEGSLIENTINILISDEILQDFITAELHGDTHEEQLFSIALELCITWLNRILFLKLLESQLVRFNSSSDYLFLNNTKIRDFEELRELFFEVLAVKPNERKKLIQTKYEKIPYLNSSLFELTDLEKETVKINQIKSHSELPVFSSTVLKDFSGKKIVGSKPLLHYLFDFLDSYNFANDKKAVIQNENKTIISSSVLGLIFEKINGYKEGSFYTPGFITMHMSRESIHRAIVEKFKTQPGFENVSSITDIHNSLNISNLKQANELFNTIRICDPAVGSGHFLVSALNELIAVKSELKILTDKDGKLLRDVDIEVINDELFISVENEMFSYNYKNKSSRTIQETIFFEKQTLIENCLFGVDINPKSVNICRLRLWIELLKNAFYTSESNFKELETLPNIDINIKCGNSLVSRFTLNGNGFQNGMLQNMRHATRQYKEQVILYKSTDDKTTKKNCESKISELKQHYISLVNPYDKELTAIRQKENELKNKPLIFSKEDQVLWNNKFVEISAEIDDLQKKYQQKLNTLYSNAFEWRFEFPEVLDDDGNFVGFDVIIGNPPYGIFNKKQNQKISIKTSDDAVIEFYKNTYKAAAEGMINASKLFYLLGFNLLKTNGINSMIIPYGFLADVSSAKIRQHIFEHFKINSIEVFPERDNASKRVFDEAKISTAIISTQKSKPENDFSLGISFEKRMSDKKIRLSVSEIKQLSGEKLTIPLINQDELNVLLKIAAAKTVPLKEFSECLTGEVDISLAKDAITDKKTKFPLIKGVQIDRFTLKLSDTEISQGKIQFLNLEKFKKNYSGQKLNHSQQQRIVLQGLTGVNEKRRIKATLVPKDYFLANSCNYILLNDKINSNYLLALLNSKILNFVFKCKSTNSNVNGYEINELPIMLAKNTKKIEELIDTILLKKENNNAADISKEEQKIDNELYKIYSFTKEEISIIERKL